MNRAWDCATGLENYVKNFLTTLPLVGELKQPSMRPRHWKQLMQATGVQFSMLFAVLLYPNYHTSNQRRFQIG